MSADVPSLWRGSRFCTDADNGNKVCFRVDVNLPCHSSSVVADSTESDRGRRARLTVWRLRRAYIASANPGVDRRPVSPRLIRRATVAAARLLSRTSWRRNNDAIKLFRCRPDQVAACTEHQSRSSGCDRWSLRSLSMTVT